MLPEESSFQEATPYREPAPSSEAPMRATLGYTAPFVAFVVLMGIERAIGLPAVYFYPIRFIAVLSLILIFSRPYVSFRPQFPLASIGLGVGVFVIWIAPDVPLPRATIGSRPGMFE
jgi:hypothetical protein